MGQQTKVCRSCNLEKGIDDFRKSNKSRDGYECSCKNCRKLEYLKNKDKVIARVMQLTVEIVGFCRNPEEIERTT